MHNATEDETPTERTLRLVREEWAEPYRAALERINRLAADWTIGARNPQTPSERTAQTTLLLIQRAAEAVLYPPKENPTP